MKQFYAVLVLEEEVAAVEVGDALPKRPHRLTSNGKQPIVSTSYLTKHHLG